jgi:hypothetical protein
VKTLVLAPTTVANGSPNINTSLVASATQYLRLQGFFITAGLPSAGLVLSYTVQLGSTVVFQGSHYASTVAGFIAQHVMLPKGEYYEGAPGEDVTVTVTDETSGTNITQVRYVLYYTLHESARGV